MIKGNYNFTLSLCGDLFISRRLPAKWDEKLIEISDLLQKHDCKFGNLETAILKKNEGYPELFPGGGYAMAEPGCLVDLKAIGFNLFNTATNHAMDYSHNGLLKTIYYLQRADIPFAGTGANLSEAVVPTFFECTSGRIALIGVTASFHDSYAAGPQNQDMIGRPGVAPLRHKSVYEVDKKNYDDLCRIVEQTNINSYYNMGVQTGYLLASSNLKIGPYEFKKGKTNKLHTTPDAEDLERTINSIKDAKIQADFVIISIHSHQFREQNRKLTPEFIKMFAHSCIDAGADIVVCHGPHLLRGIECYNNGIIFHGLGNFIFQHEQQKVVPEEFYKKYGTSRQTSTGVGGVNNIRSNGGKVGLVASHDEWRSAIFSLECSNAGINVIIHPVEISKSTGLPFLSTDNSILHELNQLSGEWEVCLDIDEEKHLGRLRISY